MLRVYREGHNRYLLYISIHVLFIFHGSGRARAIPEAKGMLRTVAAGHTIN